MLIPESDQNRKPHGALRQRDFQDAANAYVSHGVVLRVNTSAPHGVEIELGAVRRRQAAGTGAGGKAKGATQMC